MKIVKILSLLFLIPNLSAQVLGGLETFTKLDNANSWVLFDLSTSQFTDPLWKLPNSPDPSDPEIYGRFVNDFFLSLFATDLSSSGYFVGDYTAAKIDTIESEIYVEDPNTFDSLEVYLFANGLFYYSDYFEIDFPGWSSFELSLRQGNWYIYDEEEEEYFFVTLTDSILSDVEEIGFNFYPFSAAANGKAVAIDNFALLPDFTPPVVSLTPSGNQVVFAFEGTEGFEYTIEASPNLLGNSWTPAAVPFEASGPSQTPIPLDNKSFFRLSYLPYYIEVP